MKRFFKAAALLLFGMVFGVFALAIPAVKAAESLTFYFQEFDYNATRASCTLKAGIALNSVGFKNIDTFVSHDSSVVYGFATDNAIGAIICTGKDADEKSAAMQMMIGPDVPALKAVYDRLDKAFT